MIANFLSTGGYSFVPSRECVEETELIITYGYGEIGAHIVEVDGVCPTFVNRSHTNSMWISLLSYLSWVISEMDLFFERSNYVN